MTQEKFHGIIVGIGIGVLGLPVLCFLVDLFFNYLKKYIEKRAMILRAKKSTRNYIVGRSLK